MPICEKLPAICDIICKKQPRYVKNNYAFVADISKLDHVCYTLADDSGKWVNNGQHKFALVKTENNGFQKVRGDQFDEDIIPQQLNTLHRHYYYNKDSRDFHQTTGCIKKLNKPEIALRLCKAPQSTTFFIEIGCLGTNNVV